MRIVKPPEFYQTKGFSVFLAGSIEMGTCADWQNELIQLVEDHTEWSSNFTIYSPRRDDFDATQDQHISNPYFFQQVTWELDYIDKCDVVVMYLDPVTKSPISVFELGYLAGKCPQKLVVCCPDRFYRKGNVDIICHRFGIEQVPYIASLAGALIYKESQHGKH